MGVGAEVPGWKACPRPDARVLEGRHARLEPIDPEAHSAGLFEANSEDSQGDIWTYLAYGPFDSLGAYRAWIEEFAVSDDPFFYAIRDLETGKLGGVASYLVIVPEFGSIEAGHINLAPRLQRTRAATEAIYLMMKWAFESGYRRFEWKCNSLNAASRRAAIRYGLSYEGVFRNHMVVKGRNRDTAWFAAVDSEWPALDQAFRDWLDPSNFGADGMQKTRLSDLTRGVLVQADPGIS